MTRFIKKNTKIIMAISTIMIIIGWFTSIIYKKTVYMHVKNTNIQGELININNIPMKRVNIIYFIDDARVKNFKPAYSIETLFVFDENKKYITQIPTVQSAAKNGNFEEKRANFYLSCDIPVNKVVLDLFKRNGFIYIKQAFASTPFPILPNPETDFMTIHVDKEKLKDLQCD